jgi:hypothetical protein
MSEQTAGLAPRQHDLLVEAKAIAECSRQVTTCEGYLRCARSKGHP